MRTEEITAFLDSVTHEDCALKWKDGIFYCLGMTYSPEENEYCLEVYKDDAVTHEFVREILSFTSPSQDECMKHFTEDKIWDGKSFYEVAHEMEWVDL